MTRATTMIVLFLALLAPQNLRAQSSGNEFLKQVCEGMPIEDRCEIAKNYPEGKCSIGLEGTNIEGNYVDPGHGNRDGSILLLGYTGCEPHGNNWGGSLVFDKLKSGYAFVGYQPGFVFQKCINIKKDAGERLFCINRFMQQGFESTSLEEIRFGRDTSGKLHVDSLVFLEGEDNEGAYGANTVSCSSKMELIGFDRLRPGPRNSSVVLRVRYVDEADIRNACAAGAKPPREVAQSPVTGEAYIAPTGQAFISKAHIRTEYLVLDLNTRQLISQKSGKSFNPRRRVGDGAP